MKRFVTTALAAAAFSAAAALAVVPAADAKVNVHIGIGVGTWYGPGYYGGGWRDRISCREGRWLLQNRGFWRIQPLDCSGRYYTYRAWRYGGPVLVRVDAAWGSIIRVIRD